MSLAELAILPGRCVGAERFAAIPAELVRLGQRQTLASRVLSRALALPPVSAPQQPVPPLDWQQALTNAGLAVWAPAIRRVVAREQIRRLIAELGASDYRHALSLPALPVAETRPLPSPLPLAIQRSGRRLLASALATQGEGWREFAADLYQVPVARLDTQGADLAALLPLLTHTQEQAA